MNEQMVNDFLSSKDEKKKLHAVVFLEKKGNLTHIRHLMELIKEAIDPYLKRSACHSVAAIIRRNLIRNYSGMTNKMRRQLVSILKKLDSQVVITLAEDLKSTNEDVRFNAVRVLALIGDHPQIRTVIKNLVTDKNELVRATAVSLLSKMTNSVDMELLSTILKDDDKRVVSNCIEVIEAMDQPRFIPLLLKLKHHSVNRTRGNVVKALWKMGHNSKEVFEMLTEMVSDNENFLMRATACWVIGECANDCDFEFLELLASCANDPEKLVRENVIKAQIKIGGDAIEVYQKKLSNPKEVEEIKKLLQEQ